MKTRHLLRSILVATATMIAFAPVATRAAAPAAGTWTATGSMYEARGYQTATVLANGLVLVAGGVDSNNHLLASAELYHPHTGSWAATGSMPEPRVQFTATLLHNGQVLVVGGSSNGSITPASTELYNPQTGKWTRTGSLHVPRTLSTATLLPDGRVLVAGGAAGCRNGTCFGILSSAELYNPQTGIWTMTGAMHRAGARQTATLLPDGRVLVAGVAAKYSHYTCYPEFASAELYEPQTGKWTVTGPMRTAACGRGATLLPNGLVLVEGGYDGIRPITDAELYHPRTGTWTVTGPMHDSRDYQTGQTATLLPNGQVLVEGYITDTSGNPSTRAELYNPRTGTWSVTGSLHDARVYPTATLLPSGQVLVAGGQGSGDLLASAELYQP